MFGFTFVEKVRNAKSLEHLSSLIKSAEDGSGSMMDLSTEETEKVGLIIAAAMSYIAADIEKLGEFVSKFSRCKSRALAIEAFIAKNGLIDMNTVQALIGLANSIEAREDCIESHCAVTGKLIRDIHELSWGTIINPTSESTVADLVAMAEFLTYDGDDVPEKLRVLVDRIVECAKQFAFNDIITIAKAIHLYQSKNNLLLHLLNTIGIKTVEEAVSVLAATKENSPGGREVVNAVIRQIVANCPPDTDIVGTIDESGAMCSSIAIAIPIGGMGISPFGISGLPADLLSLLSRRRKT